MSNFNTLRLNRRTVNNLKIKGKKWLEEHITSERESLKKVPDYEQGPFLLYVASLEKALEELNKGI